MSSVQVEQKSYEMPPREGISIAHFLTVADIERSARYYEKVFGGTHPEHGRRQRTRIHSDCQYVADPQRWRRADSRQADGNAQRPRIRITSTASWNMRVADIQACYESWKSRGARSSSRSRSPSTAKYAATSAILTVLLIEVGQSTEVRLSSA